MHPENIQYRDRRDKECGISAGESIRLRGMKRAGEPSGQHRLIDPFGPLDSPKEKSSHEAYKCLNSLPFFSKRAHVPRPYDFHRLFHQHKDVAVKKQELGDEDVMNAEFLECMANAGKRSRGDEQQH